MDTLAWIAVAVFITVTIISFCFFSRLYNELFRDIIGNDRATKAFSEMIALIVSVLFGFGAFIILLGICTVFSIMFVILF